MKEIGEKLREARESIGISIDEVAEDLKMEISQLESVENGDIKAFKDIFSLKYFIRDYSKYLGLSYEDMVDEFNEYLFDYTSQISIKEIKAATSNQEDKEEPKVKSPYTVGNKMKKMIPPIILWIMVLIATLIAVYFVVITITDNNDKEPKMNKVIE